MNRKNALSLFDLTGELAVVTGGGRNIGAHYCRALGEAGANVVIADIDLESAERTADELTKDGITALPVWVDVSNMEAVTKMASKVRDELGPASIVVNNAALFLNLPRAPFWELPLDDWPRVLEVNVTGVAMVTAAFVPHFRELGRGKVINISSTTVHKGFPNRLHYVASKSAVIGMTRSMARELGEYNVNVNCIAPGQTATDEWLQKAGDEYFRPGVQARALKRLQRPSDLIGTLLYLASRASDFVTGQTIVVDGGAYML